MIGFKQFLNEIFDNPFKWKNILQHSRESVYRFGSFDIYKTNITKSDVPGHDTHTVRFDYNGSYYPQKTGTDPFRVYATVKDIVKDYSKDNVHSGDRIFFMAVDDRTVPIYNRLASKIASDIGGEVERSGPSGYIIKKK